MRRRGVSRDQPGALTLLAARRRPGLLVAQLDADAAGELLDGLGERQVVELDEEVDDVAAVAAAEAVEQPLGGADLEATATSRRGRGTGP